MVCFKRFERVTIGEGMGNYVDLKNEIKALIKKGNEMYNCFKKYQSSKDVFDLGVFLDNYEKWYSKTVIVVKQFSPDRLNDFVSKYTNEKRKHIDVTTYTISDALRLLCDNNKNLELVYAAMPLLGQVKILEACLEMFDNRLYEIQAILQADIFDSEIESAKHLLKKGFLRAAGAICGVVLEKHFADVCKNRSISINKKSPTIADFNDALKDNVYDVVEWRKIQHLGDVRNLCDHNKDREPTKEEVEELINGTDRVIKTIF